MRSMTSEDSICTLDISSATSCSSLVRKLYLSPFLAALFSRTSRSSDACTSRRSSTLSTSMESIMRLAMLFTLGVMSPM